MSFGGGGGITGVGNHVHDNSVGEGGSLSMPDTLISDANLFSMMMVVG